MEMVGHPQAGAGMPAGPVEHQHHLLVRSDPHLAREGRQDRLEEFETDPAEQKPDGPSRGGMDEGGQIAPLVAVLDRGEWSLAGEGPDFAEDGLEADAVLVAGPELDLGMGEGDGDLAEERAKPPLNASWAAASARTCRGRGA
jgi:hypothetical protein